LAIDTKELALMKSVNKVILIGHLGKDPEMKFTQGGMPVAKFTLATNERQKDKDGNWQERTEWHNIVAFQRTAEIVGEYLKKGRQVYIEGSLRTGSWDDKETGKKMYKTDILVNDLVLLGGGRGEGGGGGQTGGSRGASASAGGNNFDQSAPEPEHAPAGTSPITDEDIPF
jgi:single-strand DNA-binding protein